MLSPFDIRFFKEIELFVEEQRAEFYQRVASSQSFDDVQKWIGYMQALEDVLSEGAEIERRLTSGKD
jgi:hypothetical protein